MNITHFDQKTYWSRAVRAGSFLFLSGQTAQGAPACDDVQSQTREVLRRIDEILAANGSGKSSLLSATLHLRDIRDLPLVNAVWQDWVVPGHFPARTSVQAALAHDHLQIEITVVAAVSGDEVLASPPIEPHVGNSQ